MRCLPLTLSFLAYANATILENGQVREDPYPGQASIVTTSDSTAWRNYGPNATELSYKGRWDDMHISCEFRLSMKNN